MRVALTLVFLMFALLVSCRRCEDVHESLNSSWESWLPYASGDLAVFSNGVQTDTLRVLDVTLSTLSQANGSCKHTYDSVKATLLFDSRMFDTIVVSIKSGMLEINRLGGTAVVNIAQPSLAYQLSSYAHFYESETIQNTTYSHVIYIGQYPENNTSIRYAPYLGMFAFMDTSGYLWLKM